MFIPVLLGKFQHSNYVAQGRQSIKKIRLALLAVVILFLSGCFTNNWLVTVKRDGSGTISVDFSMDKSMMEMMQSFSEDGDDAPPSSSEDLIDPEGMRELASAMGEGVRFVSATPVSDSSGSMGYTALFEYDDISRVRINPMLGAPTDEEESADGDAVTFGFDRAGRPRLTISIQQSGEDEDESDEYDEQSPEEAAMMASMMKPFLGGMAFSVAVKIDSGIHSTDASYVDGDTVTIMDFQMDKILDNEKLFSKVVASSSVSEKDIQKDLAAAGVRIEAKETVTVDFR